MTRNKLAVLLSFAVLLAVGCSQAAPKQHGMGMGHHSPEMQKKIMMLQKMAPYRGYLAAHKGVRRPQSLLGGAVKVSIKQDKGGVFVALPDNRRLDEDVVGTPQMPRAFGGTPGIDGVPPMVRGVANGHYTKVMKKTPFGDKFIVMRNGKLHIEAVDRTATDAAVSGDSVRFRASWQDKAGNTYEVRCCKMLAVHGAEFPTFGGVVTNHILHGSSRIGTALMPTEFTYFAFWGMGSVLKNGKVMAQPRLIHGMLTEYVRKAGYKLAFDREVTPTKLHFHLMVPPMMPNMKQGGFKHLPVKTGFKLPNGMELPFWHVMFENLEVRSTRE
ncbi:MAG: hypothetical protein D6780_03365 [Candidatus Dadabacteria bacterium]|nr:MAG: hypothetical protein D6780_03365 [Candidatus Dadabacteria bacterium]